MKDQSFVSVRIRNWSEYKGRKDVEHNSWFRCSNRLLEDPDFFDFTHEEILVWIYILSLSSQKNSDFVNIKFAHAERVCRLSRSAILSAIEKLSENQIDPVDVPPQPRSRNGDDTRTCATDKQTDITDRQYTSNSADAEPDSGSSFSAMDLLKIWNENCGPDLAKARGISSKRRVAAGARIKDSPDPEYWRGVVRRIAESDFCKNKAPNSKGWKATFAWLLKPDTHLNVLEGMYDSRDDAGVGRASGERWEALAGRLFAAIKKFESGNPAIGEFIGAEDWCWVSRARIMSTVRAMDDTDWNRKRLAKDLKAAHAALNQQAQQQTNGGIA